MSEVDKSMAKIGLILPRHKKEFQDFTREIGCEDKDIDMKKEEVIFIFIFDENMIFGQQI